MSKRKLPDDKARKRVVDDLDRSLIVEGGAGSGKTRSLTDRMLAIIRSGRTTVFNMAAVTFTRKAAAELRERFQIELEKALRSKDLTPSEKQCLQNALGNLEHCFVGTIHSFCARLLRERPVEARIAPDFQEIEDAEEDSLRTEFWNQYVERLRQSEDPALQRLEALDVSPADLYSALSRIARYPDVKVVPQPRAKPDVSAARRALDELLEYARAALPREEPESGWDGVQSLFRYLLRLRSLPGWDDDRRFLRAIARFEKSDAEKVTQNRWSSRETALDACQRSIAYRDQHAIPALKAWREYRHAELLSVLLPAAEEYEAYRLRRGQLDFQDLLMQAAKLLREHPEVRRDFTERYACLLVDEYQDTDPVQAEVMFLLAAGDPTEKDWTRCHPRPGSLFVVGDPKQSIYRFRRADIDTYTRTHELMGGKDAEVRLTTNFRTTPTIGKFVNETFQPELPSVASRYQAAFAPVEAVRPDPKALHGVFKLSTPKQDRNSAERIVAADAEVMASWIAWACKGKLRVPCSEEEAATDRPAQYGDFMIIPWYTKHLAAYGRALERKGIPFEMTGAGSLADSREFKEVVKLLRCVGDPDDEVRLVAALRGLCFGIDDETLFRFRQAGGRFSFLADHEGTHFDGDDGLHAALTTLKQYWQWAHAMPAEVALEKILEHSGLLPLAVSASMGESAAGSLLKAVEGVRNASVEGQTSFFEAIDLLEKLAEGSEEGSLLPGRANAVRLLNLHKAKGMEAPVVFLADPTGEKTHDPEEHIDRLVTPARGHFLITCPRGEWGTEIIAQPPGWESIAQEEERYQQAEKTRLLYVAATRAKNILVISRYDAKPEISPWSFFEPWLAPIGELPQAVVPDQARPKLRASDLRFEKQRRGIEKAKTAVAEHSFARETVTSMAKDAPQPPRTLTGDGMSWGSSVHRVLHAATGGLGVEPLRLLSRNILVDEGRSPDECDRLVTLVESVLASPFWARVRKTKRCLTEVPFGLPVTATAGCPTTVLRGVADLVFQEKDGWVIVDYKTDTIGEAGVEPFVRAYEPQVRAYAKHWTQLTGESAKSCYLFFTDKMAAVELTGQT
jgi:ATP-dependent helicase/nuclease subunit A